MAEVRADVWAVGDAYEPYVGRWSRLVAAEFVAWLGVPPGARWLEVGCGTGCDSEAAFSRAFTRQFGEPPARWRALRRPA